MKAIKKQLKSIALILSMLILLQGCTVYKSANVTLEEAVKSNTRTKVKTNNSQILKFNRVIYEDDHYFGINKKYSDDPFDHSKLDILKTPLNPINLKIVKIKNKTLSTILPFAVPIVLMGGLLIIVGVCGGY